ncbi:MAG: glycosyltransferase [Janthinobacterium lividum]
MKILLVTEYFYPQSSGGTELYVYNLAQTLQKQHHQVEVLSVSNNEEVCNYKGITVHYIPFNKDFASTVIIGEKPADNLAAFVYAVQKINPDIVHFHTLTTSISTHHLAAIKQHNYKIVFTSHIAAHTCLRGTLMQLGKQVCDGKVEKQKCLSCYLQHKGIPEPLNFLSAFIIGTVNFPHNLAKVVTRKKEELARLNLNLDKLVVVSEWQQEVLKRNQFDQQKIVVCRQAVEVHNPSSVIKKENGKLIIGFIGRIAAIKGLHILLASLKNIAAESFILKVAAIPVAEELNYYQQQKKHVESMPNAAWIENLPNESVSSFLKELDILCVPSQCLETGPFVIYEALTQGVPVVGSDLGGIKELIIEGKNGWLFPHQDEKYLSWLITSFITQKAESKLLKNVEIISRKTEKLGEEMLDVYYEVLTND